MNSDDVDALRHRLQALEAENATLAARLAALSEPDGSTFDTPLHAVASPIADHAAVSVAVLRCPELRFEHIHPAFAQAIGLDGALGLAARDVLTGHLERRFIDLMEEAYRRGEPVRARNLLSTHGPDANRPAGETLDLLYTPLRTAEGVVDGVFVQQIAVTEQPPATPLSVLERERYRFLFNAMDEGFCIIEFFDGPHGPMSDYIHIEANPAYTAHAGIPNVVGQKLREMVGEEADRWVERYGHVLHTGETIRFEQELVATGRYLEVNAFRLEPASRNQVAVLFQDITPRKRAEEELRQLNESLEARAQTAVAARRLLSNVVDGAKALIHVLDFDFRCLAINGTCAREFEQVFGVRSEIGECVLDVLAGQPENQERFRALWARALQGEEYTEIIAFGERRYEMQLSSLRGQGGEQIGAYLFGYDITGA